MAPPVLTEARLEALRTTFSLLYQRGYDRADIVYPELVTEVPSSNKSNTYGWMLDNDDMREWLGERIVRGVAEHSFVVVNKHFELTKGINRDDFEDDNLGIYNMIVESMGVTTRQHPDKLLDGLLKNGHSTLCFDGQNFFDTDHPIDVKAGTGTQQNYWASGKALTTANYEEVRGTMGGYVGDNNIPLMVRPNILLVPPQLEGTARRIVEAELNEGGNTNVNRGTAKVVVSPRLATTATTWYLLDTRKPIRPFVFQKRRAPVMVFKTDAKDDNVWKNNELQYGTDGRYNMGYALWFLAAKAVA